MISVAQQNGVNINVTTHKLKKLGNKIADSKKAWLNKRINTLKQFAKDEKVAASDTITFIQKEFDSMKTIFDEKKIWSDDEDEYDI